MLNEQKKKKKKAATTKCIGFCIDEQFEWIINYRRLIIPWSVCRYDFFYSFYYDSVLFLCDIITIILHELLEGRGKGLSIA